MIARTLCGLAILAASIAACSAAPSSGVRLLAYQIVAPTAASPGHSAPGFVTVHFENDRPMPAQRVRFAFVGDDDRTYQVDDVGSFQPNIRVTHSFALSHLRQDTSLQIVYVRFADGREWVSDDLPAASGIR